MIDWMLGCIAAVFVFVFAQQIFDCFLVACRFMTLFIVSALVFVAMFIAFVFKEFSRGSK